MKKIYVFFFLLLALTKSSYGASHTDEVTTKLNTCVENILIILKENPDIFQKNSLEYGNNPDVYGPRKKESALCEALTYKDYYAVANLLLCNPTPDAFLTSDNAKTESNALHLTLVNIKHMSVNYNKKNHKIILKLLHEIIHALLLIGFNPHAINRYQATPFGMLLEAMRLSDFLLKNETIESIFMLFLNSGVNVDFQTEHSRLPLGTFITTIDSLTSKPRVFHYLRILIRYHANPNISYAASNRSCSLLELIAIRKQHCIKNKNVLAAQWYQEAFDILNG